MNEQQANDAVRDYPTRVVARDGQGGVHGRGIVFAYSIVPVLHIRTDDGREFTWRHDMTEFEAAPARGSEA